MARRPFPTVSFKTALNDSTKSFCLLFRCFSLLFHRAAVSTYGILFFYCGMMFSFVIIIYQIVYEKERHLKQGMKLMGLKSSVYWTSWFIYGTVMTFLEAMAMMGS